MTSAITGLERIVAVFALHALWQVPLLAAVAWFAVRLGRPHVRLAHALWVGTLVLSVALPLCSSLLARQAALQAQRDATGALVSLEAAEFHGVLPVLQREAAWQRLLHRHLSRQHGLQPFFFVVPQVWARLIACSYMVALCFFGVELLLAWRRMRAIVRAATCECIPPDFVALLQQQCRQAGLPTPAVRASADLAGPALAGVLRPTLLLPVGASLVSNGVEAEAVLAHELAHLQRHDPALQAMCSLLLLLISFHPAAWWTARRVRHSREMACDADAAASMGSRPVYARALLAVAERIGSRRTAGGMLSFFGIGLFGAGLGLFNEVGAMEERMQMLMESQQPETRTSRIVRIAACVSLSAVAVLAAGMLQVRPALADERAVAQKAMSSGQVNASTSVQGSADTDPRLSGGDHAREQLRSAGQSLQQAEQDATNDEDRRRIATAQQVAAAGKDALATANGQSNSTDVQIDFSKLKLPNLNALQAQLAAQQAAMAKLQAYFDSPEWKARMEQQLQAVAKQQTYFDSPAWKARMEQQQKAMAKLRAEMDSPALRARIESAGKVNTEHLRRLVTNAMQQQTKALEQIRSSNIQKQIDPATQFLAENEAPALVPPVETDNPIKVQPGVMAGNATHKETPIYPAEAKEKKIQGAVVLHAIISEQGLVEQLSIVSSPDALLSKSALDAVHQWTYKPYLLNGQAVAVDTTVTVTYSLAP